MGRTRRDSCAGRRRTAAEDADRDVVRAARILQECGMRDVGDPPVRRSRVFTPPESGRNAMVRPMTRTMAGRTRTDRGRPPAPHHGPNTARSVPRRRIASHADRTPQRHAPVRSRTAPAQTPSIRARLRRCEGSKRVRRRPGGGELLSLPRTRRRTMPGPFLPRPALGGDGRLPRKRRGRMSHVPPPSDGGGTGCRVRPLPHSRSRDAHP